MSIKRSKLLRLPDGVLLELNRLILRYGHTINDLIYWLSSQGYSGWTSRSALARYVKELREKPEEMAYYRLSDEQAGRPEADRLLAEIGRLSVLQNGLMAQLLRLRQEDGDA